MPHIVFKGCKLEEVKAIKEEVLNTCIKEMNVERNHFTIEHLNVTFVESGYDDINNYPFVEIKAFPRSKEVMDNISNFINSKFKKLGYTVCTVYFNELDKSKYYKS